MAKRITTQVTVVSVNELSDEEEAQILRVRDGVDSIADVASNLEEQVEAIVATQLFADADEIPILDVNTEVENLSEADVKSEAKTAAEEVQWTDE